MQAEAALDPQLQHNVGLRVGATPEVAPVTHEVGLQAVGHPQGRDDAQVHVAQQADLRHQPRPMTVADADAQASPNQPRLSSLQKCRR